MSVAVSARGMERLQSRYPGVFSKPLEEKVRLVLLWAGFALLTLYTFWRLGFFDFSMILKGLDRMGDVLAFMLPPRANGYFGEFVHAILETLAMAFLGTLAASVAAVPLGFLGARNVVGNRVIHFGLRRVFDVLRGVDSLIWALIFINAVGLGPFAGILAIAASDTGTLSKLFSEAIENVDSRQVDGVKASGGGMLTIMRFGMLPQVLPVLLSNSLYYFESNTRSATILGIVGAGGIGLQLSDRIRVNNWNEAAFIILLILATVYLIDRFSGMLRHRIIGKPGHGRGA